MSSKRLGKAEVAARFAAIEARMEKLLGAPVALAAALRAAIQKELDSIKASVFGHGPKTSRETTKVAEKLYRLELQLSLPTAVEEEARRAAAAEEEARRVNAEAQDAQDAYDRGVQDERAAAEEPLRRITLGEIASRGGFSKSTARRLIKLGLPVVHVSQNSLRGNWRKIDRWVREHRRVREQDGGEPI